MRHHNFVERLCQPRKLSGFTETPYSLRAQQLYDDLRQDQLMIELSGYELKIRLETGLHALNQLFGFEAMRLLRSDSERVGVNRPVFFARQMFGRFCR